MNYWLAGWKSAHRERARHRETRAAYAALLVERQRLVVELEREKERSAHTAWLASEPCESCAVLERERNDAQLAVDTLEADVAHLSATRSDLERLLFGQVRADGEAL